MLASAEGADEDPGKQMPMVIMASGGVFNYGNSSNWWNQRHHSFPNQTCSENTNWETAVVCMSVAEEAIKKATGRVNALLNCWGCTTSPIYHADRFHTYRNSPNKMDPDVSERAKRSIQEYAQHN